MVPVSRRLQTVLLEKTDNHFEYTQKQQLRGFRIDIGHSFVSHTCTVDNAIQVSTCTYNKDLV
jgi:hypothetical protein